MLKNKQKLADLGWMPKLREVTTQGEFLYFIFFHFSFNSYTLRVNS